MEENGQDKTDYLKEYPAQIKSRVLASLLYVSAGVGMWCFGENKKFYYSTCRGEKEFLNLLELNGSLEYLYKRKEGWELPVMLSDELGVTWIAENTFEEGSPSLLFLIGPFFLTDMSAAVIERKLKEREISISLKRKLSRLLGIVPVMYRPIMDQYVSMLHFTLTSEPLGRTGIYYQGSEVDRPETGEEEDESLEMEILNMSEKALRGEKLLLKAVSDGNLNYNEIFKNEVIQGEDSGFISKTGDTLRDAKNTVLVFSSLCCRAAIDGGVPVKVCKKMEKQNAGEVERCTTITELSNLNSKLLYNYVKTVHDSKENPFLSKSTLECCEYIKSNAFKPITAESITGSLGYSTYYFTKKFYKEMGVRITDYIKQTRIEYAKLELLVGTKSVQEISDSLQFSTYNYFSKVFKEMTGMSPAEFRRKAGRDE